MTDLLRTRTVVPVLALGLLVLPACRGVDLDLSLNEIEGSGVPETTTFDTADFDEIEVTSVFDVTLLIAEGDPSVEVTVDDNLIDDLDVEVDGDRLRIGFERGSYDLNVNPTAMVTVASIDGIEVNGASSLTADGIEGDELRIDVSGASHLTATGNVAVVTIDASGASDVDLSGLDVETATVDASGASDVELGSADRVDGELSGASNLTAPAEAVGSIGTSGASNVRRN